MKKGPELEQSVEGLGTNIRTHLGRIATWWRASRWRAQRLKDVANEARRESPSRGAARAAARAAIASEEDALLHSRGLAARLSARWAELQRDR